MIGELLDVLLVSGLAAGGGRRRRTVPRPVPSPVPRPAWWKGLAIGLLLLQQLPLLLGAALLLKVGFEFGRDDLLMIIGLVVFSFAAVFATFALAIAAWAVTMATRIARDHGHARWYVGGFGLGGVFVAMPLVGAGNSHPLVVLFVTASVALLIVAIGAPADEGP